MKHCLLYVCLLGWIPMNVQAQDGHSADSCFSVTLQLKKPSFNVDRHSYFLLTLYNHTNDMVYLAPARDGRHRMQYYSFLCTQYLTKSGEIITNRVGTCLFIDENLPLQYKFVPHSSCSVRLPLMQQDADLTETGVLSRRGNSKYVKVRAGIKKFTLFGLKSRQVKAFTQYSNWIDISGEDFSKLGG